MMQNLALDERMQFLNPSLDTIVVGKFTFTSNCPDLSLNQNPILIEWSHYERCNIKDWIDMQKNDTNTDLANSIKSNSSIASPIDSRSYYFVLNDNVCNNVDLPAYVYTRQLKHYNPVELTLPEFCSTWLKSEN